MKYQLLLKVRTTVVPGDTAGWDRHFLSYLQGSEGSTEVLPCVPRAGYECNLPNHFFFVV